MGGEPTFVSIDDFDGPEWNTAAVGRTKRARAETLIRRLRALRARRLPALRPGQMVSRREPAALGLRALLAQGRRADLAGPRADRRRRGARGGERRGRCRRSPAKSPRASASSPTTSSPPTRTRPIGCWRERAAGQRRSLRPEDRRSRRARAHGAHLRARPVAPTGYVLPVQRWNAAAKPALALRALAAPARQAVSRARRFAGRLAPAAEVAALRHAVGLSLRHEQDPMEPRGRIAGAACSFAQVAHAPARRRAADASRTVRRRRRGAHRA